MHALSLLIIAAFFGAYPSTFGDKVSDLAPLSPLEITPAQAPLASAAIELKPTGAITLTRDAAINQALSCNPALNEARQALERATGQMWQVRSHLLPKVTGFYQRTSRDHSTLDYGRSLEYVPIDNRYLATQSESYGIEFRQLFFDGFGALNNYWRSDYQKEASYWQMIAAGFSTMAQLQQMYDAILFREATVSIYSETVKAFEQLNEITAKQEKAGQKTPLDGLRVQTELKRYMGQRAVARSELAAARERLQVLLQLPACSEAGPTLILEGPLDKRSFDISLDVALQRAGCMHPEIFAAQLNRDAAEAGWRSSMSTYAPRIEGFARYGVNTSYADYSLQLDGWTLGIVGNWLIFDSLGREGHIRSQKADLMTAEIRLSDQRYRLMARVRELFAQQAAYAEALDAQYQAVIVGERAVNESIQRYKIGEVDIEMVIDAQRSFQAVMLEFNKHIYDYNATIYQLEYVVGIEPVTPVQIACGPSA